MNAAARVTEILNANGFRRIGISQMYASKTAPGQLLAINNAIECEAAQPTDIAEETGWFFGETPEGCITPWIDAAQARIDAGAHGDTEMVELIDSLA